MYAKDLIGQYATRTDRARKSPGDVGDGSWIGDKILITDVDSCCDQIKTIIYTEYGSVYHPTFTGKEWNDNNWDYYDIAKRACMVEVRIGVCKCFRVSREKAKALIDLLEA
jgi:hypothetical protein